MTFEKCFDCRRITGNPVKKEKSIILSIPQLKKPVTLESLIYSTFFCNINNNTKIVKCDCDNGSFIHDPKNTPRGFHVETTWKRQWNPRGVFVGESLIFLQPPKVLVIYTSSNIDGIKAATRGVL